MNWKKSFSFPKNSIRYKLALGILIIVLPLLALLHYYNFYTVKVVHNQVASSNQSMMYLYMNQLDSGLEAVDSYILNLISSDYELQVMNESASEEAFVLAKMKVNHKLDSDSTMYKNFVNSIFVYSPDNDSIAATLSDIGGSEFRAVNQYIQTELFSSFNEGNIPIQWFVKQIGEEAYLFRLQPMDRLWLGAWVNVKTMQQPLSLIDLGENGRSFFITEQGHPLTESEYASTRGIQLLPVDHKSYTTGTNNEYHVITEASTKGSFGLSAAVADEAVLQNLPYLNRIVIWITIIGILLIPLYFMYLRKTVLTPLNKVVYAMKRIGEGNVNTRIEPIASSDEFNIVNRTFNEMIEQMQELKISVYEEQLNKQKAELQHLQLQINPHFFMNTLNLIYSMALDKDFELIKDMTLRLVKHFRYMFRSNLTFVPLRDELEHVRNYLTIHELRFQQTYDYRIEVPEGVLHAMVPPLLIQAFVENALKYASTIENPLVLDVIVKVEQAQAIVIEIKDEGAGFEEQLLSQLNTGQRIADELGDHIGTWNVWHRLRLLYGENSSVHYCNRNPHGAKVTIRLPLHTD